MAFDSFSQSLPVVLAVVGSAMAGCGATLAKKGIDLWKKRRLTAPETRGWLFILAVALLISISGSAVFLYALSRGKASEIEIAGLVMYPVQTVTAAAYLKEKEALVLYPLCW